LAQIWSCRPWEFIIGKNSPCADHHAIFDGNGVANIYKCIDLDAIANAHIVSNVRLFANNALLTELSSVPDVDIVPNRRAGADAHSLFNNGRGMDARRHAETLVGLAREPFMLQS